MHVQPPGQRKNVGAKFTVESCKCTPQAESAPPSQSKSPVFLGNWGDLDGEKLLREF